MPAGGIGFISSSWGSLWIAKAVLASSLLQIEATLHVVNPIAVGLEYRTIAKLRWPEHGIVRMNNVPANASIVHTAL
ncbi:MAG: hypothetical protein DMF05_11155 [Verrucomicrobia bacterium]|nr:MAG: hypothetical protein DMF05_11155 [Verrucomicrobiota bacterium]